MKMVVTKVFVAIFSLKMTPQKYIENDVIVLLTLQNKLDTKLSSLYLHLGIPQKLFPSNSS